MPMYHYEATGRDGRKLVGSMNAASVAAVEQALLQRGLTPVFVEAPAQATSTPGRKLGPAASVGPPQTSGQWTPNDPLLAGIPAPPVSPHPPISSGNYAPPSQSVRRRSNVTVPSAQLALFYRQMASGAKSGMPLTSALPSIIGQIRDRRLQAAVQDMLNTISRGQAMSQAMERHPKVFRQGHVGLVRAGEGAGFLERAFTELAVQCEADSSVETATKFNIILWILNWIIIPPLPGLIWFLMNTDRLSASSGDFSMSGLKSLALESLFVFIGTFLLWNFGRPLAVRALKGTAIGLAWENLAAVLPVLGTRRRRLDSAKTLGALSSAVSAGVPHSIAWELALEAADTEYYRNRLASQMHAIRQGSTIADALAATGLYDYNTLQMARTGEESGTLPEMLQQATVFQREEAKHIGMLTPWAMGVFMYLAVMGIVAVLYVYFAYRVYSGIVERGLAL